MISKIDFFGLHLSNFKFTELVHNLKETVDSNSKTIISGYSLGTIPYLSRYPVIYRLAESSDIVVCDGRGLFLLMKLFKVTIRLEISIPNIVLLILKLAQKYHYSILLVGGTIENNRLATENLRRSYPNAVVYDGIDGYFSSDEMVLNRINELVPNILLIGISSPQKENFTIQNRKKLNYNVIIPCGGMIDVLAGKVKQTPSFFKSIGMASLFRLFQEPRRLASRYIYIYIYLFLKFFPLIFFKVGLLRIKNFSIPKFCGLDNEALSDKY